MRRPQQLRPYQSPRHTKGEMLREQSGKCYWCRRPIRVCEATFDHVVPLSKGGARYSVLNIVIACKPCNNERGDRDAADFAAQMGVPDPSARVSRERPKLRNAKPRVGAGCRRLG